MKGCRQCRRTPIFAQELCGPCFAAAHGVSWAICAECVVAGLVSIDDSTGGHWHDECAAFALSVVEKPNAHCRLCRGAQPSDGGVIDFRDRTWCLPCARKALGHLRVARTGLAMFRDNDE